MINEGKKVNVFSAFYPEWAENHPLCGRLTEFADRGYG